MRTDPTRSADVNIPAVQTLLNYTFNDPALLRAALTHGSAFEGVEKPADADYDRLEHLGASFLLPTG